MAENALTRQQIAGAFRDLGILAGDCILVHSSLRSLGYVDGGAEERCLRPVAGPPVSMAKRASLSSLPEAGSAGTRTGSGCG
jgi:hypothetical protein